MTIRTWAIFIGALFIWLSYDTPAASIDNLPAPTLTMVFTTAKPGVTATWVYPDPLANMEECISAGIATYKMLTEVGSTILTFTCETEL